jgi:hypothetical protein
MVRKIIYAVVAVALVACAGVFYSRSKGMVLPGIGARPIAEVIDRPIATGDSAELAGFAHDRCRLLIGGTKQRCYEEIMLATVERQQVRLAMDALSVLSRLDPETVARGHDLTHVVGINAWTPGEDISAVYETCTGLYQSGCYHGVVQAYLDANASDSVTVHSVCNKINAAVTNTWLRFQCVHGIGHALVQNTSLHLAKALRGCDWLVDGWDAQSCYGGAFMEFILAGRGQEHHPNKRHRSDSATAGDHGGGDHAHHEATADTFAIRNKSDPLYPCSVLATKYQSSCYGMQAGIIIEQVGADFGKIAAACDQAPASMRPSCYQGIGTYVSGFTVKNAGKSIELCAMGNPAHAAWCYVGVVKNFIDVTANPDDGFEFCARLTERHLGVACYNAVGEQVAVLNRDADAKEKHCAKAPQAYLEACRYGAALPAARPPELTPFMPAA